MAAEIPATQRRGTMRVVVTRSALVLASMLVMVGGLSFW